MGWLEVINDKKIPNSASFKVGEEEITVGQVREAYVARERGYQDREGQILKAQKELADVYGLFTQEKSMIEAERETNRREREALLAAKASETGDFGNVDGDLGKVLKRLEAAEAAIAKREAENITLNRNFTEGATVLMNALWDRDIEKYGKEVPEGYSKNDLVKLALENGLVDPKTKIPNVGRAIDLLLAPKKHEQEIKDAEERGMLKAREEMAVASIGSPTSGFRLNDMAPAGGKKFANLDEAMHAAASDPQIVKMLSGTASPEEYATWNGQ